MYHLKKFLPIHDLSLYYLGNVIIYTSVHMKGRTCFCVCIVLWHPLKCQLSVRLWMTLVWEYHHVMQRVRPASIWWSCRPGYGLNLFKLHCPVLLNGKHSAFHRVLLYNMCRFVSTIGELYQEPSKCQFSSFCFPSTAVRAK